MIFKISDSDYAVLCEIRKNKSTSIDRLKMLFCDAAESSIENLENYDLIRSEISGGQWYYYATAAGQAYSHKVTASVTLKAEPSNNNSAHDPNANRPEKKIEDNSSKRNLPLIIWREIKSFFLDILRIVFRKE